MFWSLQTAQTLTLMTFHDDVWPGCRLMNNIRLSGYYNNSKIT